MQPRFTPAVAGVLRDIGRAALAQGAGAWAVGGVVRDALRGHEARDIDVTIAGDAAAVASMLAAEWNAVSEQHDAFSTATLVRPDGFRVDIARARSEVYERPGALPTVAPAGIEADLRRRDFTVNAIAVALTVAGPGEMLGPLGGLADLESGTLRILHAGSFIDDPTRLFRAARYAVRLGLDPDPATDAAAVAAVEAGALPTVSADRKRREVELLLTEKAWPEAVAWLNRWNVWASLSGGWEPAAGALRRIDVTRAWAERSLPCEIPSGESLRWLILLSLSPDALSEALGVTPADLRLAQRVRDIVAGLGEPDGPEWWRAMDAHPLCALLAALAQAPTDPDKERLTRYLRDIRGMRLSITGDDLVEAGVRPAPVIGKALQDTLDAYRLRQVGPRAEQLAYALEAVRKDSR